MVERIYQKTVSDHMKDLDDIGVAKKNALVSTVNADKNIGLFSRGGANITTLRDLLQAQKNIEYLLFFGFPMLKKASCFSQVIVHELERSKNSSGYMSLLSKLHERSHQLYNLTAQWDSSVPQLSNGLFTSMYHESNTSIGGYQNKKFAQKLSGSSGQVVQSKIYLAKSSYEQTRYYHDLISFWFPIYNRSNQMIVLLRSLKEKACSEFTKVMVLRFKSYTQDIKRRKEYLKSLAEKKTQVARQMDLVLATLNETERNRMIQQDANLKGKLSNATMANLRSQEAEIDIQVAKTQDYLQGATTSTIDMICKGAVDEFEKMVRREATLVDIDRFLERMCLDIVEKSFESPAIVYSMYSQEICSFLDMTHKSTLEKVNVAALGKYMFKRTFPILSAKQTYQFASSFGIDADWLTNTIIARQNTGHSTYYERVMKTDKEGVQMSSIAEKKGQAELFASCLRIFIKQNAHESENFYKELPSYNGVLMHPGAKLTKDNEKSELKKHLYWAVVTNVNQVYKKNLLVACSCGNNHSSQQVEPQASIKEIIKQLGVGETLCKPVLDLYHPYSRNESKDLLTLGQFIRGNYCPFVKVQKKQTTFTGTAKFPSKIPSYLPVELSEEIQMINGILNGEELKQVICLSNETVQAKDATKSKDYFFKEGEKMAEKDQEIRESLCLKVIANNAGKLFEKKRSEFEGYLGEGRY